ncbi:MULTISPECIES: hypothetical protein [unclassified Stenotrophomonas maltophilia group]|uniref:hypothetical protein n=1 Tax=unclassified Stenotrophomonas maltophilia group TaxID=2961925 RepID=UPI003BF7A892
MSTDKTLADVQPGGRVRLGDQAERAPWRSMDTCPRDGTVVRLRWGEDHVSPGWWSAPVSPVQNDDGTWPSDTGGFPWAFIDFNNGSAFVNHAVDTEYGPTHWAPYAALSAQPSPGGQDGPAYEGHTWVSDYVLAGLRERAEMPLQLRNGEVWHWQGDGHDFPESLVCPVVMSAETLRALLAARQPVYVQGCDELRARTEGERAAYMEGLEEGKKIAARQPVGEPVCFISPIDASQLRSKDKTLRWTGTYWDRPGDDAVPVYLGPPAQAVDLGLQLDRYDAGLLGDGGGGDVNWWQDYIRAELDRAHEFYQDQADAHG